MRRSRAAASPARQASNNCVTSADPEVPVEAIFPTYLLNLLALILLKARPVYAEQTRQQKKVQPPLPLFSAASA
jgi:hypothetical protein